MVFDFIIVSDLNANANNHIQDLFISLLVDCLMYLMSKYSINILKNIKVFIVWINSDKLTTNFLFYCFLSFSFHSQYFCRRVHFHQFLWWANCHENITQLYDLKHYIVFAYFFLHMSSFFFLLTLTVLLLKSHHNLNPSLVLNLCYDVVLQVIITLIANFPTIKNL